MPAAPLAPAAVLFPPLPLEREKTEANPDMIPPARLSLLAASFVAFDALFAVRSSSAVPCASISAADERTELEREKNSTARKPCKSVVHAAARVAGEATEGCC